jgi:hypothetical protein
MYQYDKFLYPPNKKSPNKKSPNRKSPNRKSSNKKSPNRKSSNRKSSNKKSPNRKSPNKKVLKRRSPMRSTIPRYIYGGADARDRNLARQLTSTRRRRQLGVEEDFDIDEDDERDNYSEQSMDITQLLNELDIGFEGIDEVSIGRGVNAWLETDATSSRLVGLEQENLEALGSLASEYRSLAVESASTALAARGLVDVLQQTEGVGIEGLEGAVGDALESSRRGMDISDLRVSGESVRIPGTDRNSGADFDLGGLRGALGNILGNMEGNRFRWPEGALPSGPPNPVWPKFFGNPENFGSWAVNLTWNNRDDLDLSVCETSGSSCCFFYRKLQTIGTGNFELNWDDNRDLGSELYDGAGSDRTPMENIKLNSGTMPDKVMIKVTNFNETTLDRANKGPSGDKRNAVLKILETDEASGIGRVLTSVAITSDIYPKQGMDIHWIWNNATKTMSQ